MHTTIKLATSYKPADSLVLLIDDKGTLPKGMFSEKETQFIAKELKADKKSIVINQYDRLIAIYKPDKKSEINKLIENSMCRIMHHTTRVMLILKC